MNIRRQFVYAIAAIVALTSGCDRNPQNQNIWRGAIHSQGQEIPFNFLLEDQGAGFLKMTLINGKDRMAIDSIALEGDSVESRWSFLTHTSGRRLTATGWKAAGSSRTPPITVCFSRPAGGKAAGF